MPATADDVAELTALLGRPPQAEFEVVVRTPAGRPAVIRNAPLLDDGTPMPTRYWLVDPDLVLAVSRLEGDGGVRAAEAAVDAEELAAVHTTYAAERDAALPSEHRGPRPHGGVGGTRAGVKCLHAHYAYFLAGGDDPVGRWVEARLADATGAVTNRLGAIDIGTNSVRLLVADVDGAGEAAKLEPLDRRVRITRLGQGVDESHRLNPEAISRTLEALREFRGALDELTVERARATATSAARDAGNRDDFFGPAAEILRIEPELLPGTEEARLSFLGATAGLDEPSPYLTVDIGGGSTEFVAGTHEPEGLISIDIGSVRITEQHLRSDPPEPEELSAAVSVVQAHLSDVEREIPAVREAATLVGLAGTITTVAAIELGLTEYDSTKIHHFRLERTAAEDVFRTLATEPAEVRRHNPGLEPGRVDIIVGGALILVTIMRTFGFNEMLVSEADILDGLVRSISAR